MADPVKLTIDGREVQAAPGTLLIEAAKAAGIEVPSFCYYEGLTLAAYPAESFRGRTARIADTVDAQTRTVKVRAELGNSQGRLRPEMFGSVRHTESLQATPVLPAGAVVQMEGSSVVFVETATGRYKRTPVVVGNRFKDLLPIASGIKAGDRVVVDGAMLLREP